jgi:hypothetical protein
MNKQELTKAINEGLSLRKISNKLHVSVSTVRYWIKIYGLKTKKAEEMNNKYLNNWKKQQFCSICNNLLNENNSYKKHKNGTKNNLCKNCYSITIKLKRAEAKKKCINYKGGKCKHCGYMGFHEAFDFHHINGTTKEKELAKMLHCSWNQISKELDKCELLCSNCHRKEHCRLSKKDQLSKTFQTNMVSDFFDCIYTGKNTGKESCKFCDTVLTENNRGSGSHCHMCKSCDSKHVTQKGIEGKKRAVKILGGSCNKCGYSDCIKGLEIVYRNKCIMPLTFRRRYKYWGIKRQTKELENCIMICARCNRENNL